MEWERVKYIVICILIALNVGLFGLRYQQGQENILSGTQERAVFEVLSRNGITLYTDLDTTAAPMSRLRASVATYAKSDLEAVFFDGEETEVTQKGAETTYRVGEKTLVLSGFDGTFSNGELPEAMDSLSRSEVVAMGGETATNLSKLFGELQLQNIWQKGGTWGLEYVGVYNHNLVFSNECTIYMTAEGISQMTFSFAQISGSETEQKEIVFADEALITFMRDWLEMGETEEIAIQKVSVGYYLPENTAYSEGAELYLEPHYCISTLEDNQKFFVNGYTCQMVDMKVSIEEELPEMEIPTPEEEIGTFLATNPTFAEVNTYFGMEGVEVERENLEGTWYQYDVLEVAEEGEIPTDVAFVVYCSFGEEALEYDIFAVSQTPLVLDVEAEDVE